MNYKRITKPIARKLYNQGYDILLLPCKAMDSAVDGSHPFMKPTTINIKNSEHEVNKFDRTVLFYEGYNCNSEVGYYAHYFAIAEDYTKYLEE